MDGRGLALDQGVIVVNMNYRLGTLGFLSGIDDKHRGNFGVRLGSTDQLSQSFRLKTILKISKQYGPIGPSMVRGSIFSGTSKWLSNGFIEILNTLVETRIESPSLVAQRAVALWVLK